MSRMKLIHLPTCGGMQNASNIGIHETDGEFIAIHDDDDFWQPRFLSECVAYLTAQGVDSACKGVVAQTTRVLEELGSGGEIVELLREPYFPFQHVSLFQTRRRKPVSADRLPL